MAKYVKCPLCMLNYIKEGEQCCTVCKKEIDNTLYEDNEWTLCPICNLNMISSDMDMCKSCERKLRSEQD